MTDKCIHKWDGPGVHNRAFTPACSHCGHVPAVKTCSKCGLSRAMFKYLREQQYEREQGQ